MSDKAFKITVLITFYNSEKYVDDALYSVFHQNTNFSFRVIAGDDGSSDGTVSKIKAWEKKYPDRITHIIQSREEGKKYMGGTRASKNRLALLSMVDTPYFIFLDGDDFWIDDEKLQKEYDILESPSNSDCVLCAHQVKVFYEDSPERVDFYPQNGIKERKFDAKTYVAKHYFHTDSMLIRSEHIKDLPYEYLGDFFNDSIITFCFLQFGMVYYLPQCMASYRKNEGGIWAGEKKAVSIIRQIMGYDIECRIAPVYKGLLTTRNYQNFVEALELVQSGRDSGDGIDAGASSGDGIDAGPLYGDAGNRLHVSETYMEVAEKYNCTVAKNLLRNGHLFSDSIEEDRKILKKIYFDKQVNRLIYHFK